MAASGRMRFGLAGLMAVVLTACSGGDDLAELETTDPIAPPVIETQPDISQVAEPQSAAEPATQPAPDKSPDRPETETPAAPQGVTVDTLAATESRPPCGASSTCVHAGSISGGHGEPGIEVHYDPERNDAIVRWGHALGDVIACADGGDTITACVADAPFDQSCKDEFDRLSGLADELAAFDAVFLSAGSPCRPQEGQP